jgi:phosphoenolpyruvate carboxylase
MSIAVDSNAPLREVELPAADAPLRADVNRLGILVGEILSEQRGPAFLAAVERVRVAAIRRRESGGAIGELAAALRDAVGTVPAPSAMPDEPAIEQAEALARAFATYFNAVNLAERVHRIRRRRDYQLAGAAPQPGGVEDVFAAPGGRRAGAMRTARRCCRACTSSRCSPRIRPKRCGARCWKRSRTSSRAWSSDLDTSAHPGRGARAPDRERMRMHITAAWQTAEYSAGAPHGRGRTRTRGCSTCPTCCIRALPACTTPSSSAASRQVYPELANGDAAAAAAALRHLGRRRHGRQPECRRGDHRGRAGEPAPRADHLAAYRRDLAQELGSVLSQSTSRVAGVGGGAATASTTTAGAMPDAAGPGIPRATRHALPLPARS